VPALTDRPDLSVVVVTHNGRELALETLRSARGAVGGVAAEWLVVDSGSSDGTADAVERELSDVVVFRRPNIGFAAANNVALAQARGRYVLLLNPDVAVAEGTLDDLVAALDRRPGVGAASVVHRAPDGALQPSARRFPSPLRELTAALHLSRLGIARRLGVVDAVDADGARERSVDWVVGAFLAVRREALDQVGGLDERFFLYSEEKDWCFRIREAGWDVRHLPVMTIVHHCGGYERPELRAQLTYSKLLFAQKHFGPVHRAGYRGALGLKHLLRLAAFAPTAVRPQPRTRIRGELAALRLVLGASGPPMHRKEHLVGP
jgi:N-acetylglucosaminyl-diphospho-decaprenol L-rhamnosyltransferase